MEQLVFTVKGSNGKYHSITASKPTNGNLSLKCECMASNFGGFCKHRLALIYGNSSKIVKHKNPEEDFATLTEWLKGSAIADAADKVRACDEALYELEVALADAKAYLRRALKGEVDVPTFQPPETASTPQEASFKEEVLLNESWRVANKLETGERYCLVRKPTSLIVPQVTYDEETQTGDLHNGHWAFKVPYAFRDALGLNYETRRKNKNPYKVWTQSPYIHFKEGDTLRTKEDDIVLKVKMSSPMSWIKTTEQMDYGLVEFQILKRMDEKLRHHSLKSMTQYEFLRVLIYGLPESML